MAIFTMLHLHVGVDGVGVVVDGSDGSNVGPLSIVDKCIYMYVFKILENQSSIR